MKKIILLGAGGHCKSCIDVIEEQGEFEIIGIIDKKEMIGEKVLDYSIIGDDSMIPSFLKECSNFVVCVGQIKSSRARRKLFEEVKKLGGFFPVIVSPRAHVSRHAVVGEGTIVFHDALINTAAKVGVNSIVNTKALCEHDSVVGDHCHISTGAIVNGGCVIGDDVFIGSSSCLKQGVKVKDGTIVSYGTKYE